MPVLVGSLSVEKEQMYGSIFAKYLADPENLFVISSDFCHWGEFTMSVSKITVTLLGLDAYNLFFVFAYKILLKFQVRGSGILTMTNHVARYGNQ